MKIFFNSRSAMRSFSAGKAHDHGTLAVKRWSRDLSSDVAKSSNDKAKETLVKVGRDGEVQKEIPVYHRNVKSKLVNVE